MGLHPPSFAATTLASLDAAGVTIVQQDEGWFIKFGHSIIGPYNTPEAVLEASMDWLVANNTKEVGGNAAAYNNNLGCIRK